MLKKIYTPFLLMAFCLSSLFAQSLLLPSIGLDSVPVDADTICAIPTFNGNYETSGFQRGDTLPDFTLYTVDETAVNLGDLLADGKPVLLVGGSYTCPVFRNKMADLNQLYSQYADSLHIYIVYTVEAHPDIDISPYSGTVWTTGANTSAGILYQQPTTYAERKSIVNDMLADLTIDPTVLMDGPCNNWWLNYGPAPNMAYLIDTTGIVYEKQGWFNKAPADMGAAIDSLFAGAANPGNGGGGGGPGAFDFVLIDADTAYGTVGEVLTIQGSIDNYSSDPVNILIRRLQVQTPADWETSLCVDICLAPTVDETTVVVDSFASQSFTFYFFTGPNPGDGRARVGFRNIDSTANSLSQDFFAVTTEATSIDPWLLAKQIKIYPQPAQGQLSIEFSQSLLDPFSISLYSLDGRLVLTRQYDGVGAGQIIDLSLPSLSNGLYLLQIRDSEGFGSQQKIWIAD